MPAKAKKIAIVAHSFGGTVTAAMLTENIQHFRDRVVAIALTDSHPRCEGEGGKLLEKVGALESNNTGLGLWSSCFRKSLNGLV